MPEQALPSLGSVLDDESTELSLTSHRYSGYSPGSGTIWLDDLQCTSSDLMLSTCSHTRFGSTDCSHSEDVAVSCTHSNGSGKAHITCR